MSEVENPIDALLESLDDLTLDSVVQEAGEMREEDRKVRVESLRRQRALWVAK